MPGAYAHFTLVALLKEEIEIAHLSKQAVACIRDHFKFCQLGAISPSYPYLDSGNKNSKAWADAMHHENTIEMVRHGITAVTSLTGESKNKAFAWLLGYSAHLVTDTTIHPIIECKVGPYIENKKAYCECEIHQDSYIFQKLNLGEIGVCEYLSGEIGGCHAIHDAGKIDVTIKNLWEHMLNKTHPEKFTRNPPNIDRWHQKFFQAINLPEEKHQLLPIARHVAINCGLAYPLKKEIDMQYIESLPTPNYTMHYDEIFDIAKQNVKTMWRNIARSIFESDSTELIKVGNWNLDTGRDENGQLVYWDKPPVQPPVINKSNIKQ